jgi:hypothetical protein
VARESIVPVASVPRGESRLPNGHPDWWLVRFHWKPVEGFGHPEYTFSERSTETSAIDLAVSMLDKTFGPSIALLEVHTKAPGETTWSLVI